VVQRVERALFEGVSRQVRALASADLGKNLRMRRADYSRSDRLGELYDELFYRPMWGASLFGGAPAARSGDGPIELRELLIHPPGETDAFRPLRHNDRRRAPVPVLLLNATSLNTGHNWRFQAVEMGEDPRSGEDWVQIDKNMRLLSARYEQIAEHQQDFPLGHAVAASACVPGLFHPLAVSGLFRGVRVELVDGGVHDNQGVRGLLDVQCEQLIVSDASGQMGDLSRPATRIPATVGRATSIYGDRVREEELAEALIRPDTLLLHLRKGLPVRELSPRGVDGEPIAEACELGTVDYGVSREVQRLLAGVRTDLDSFSEVEAYSLSLLGYLMTSVEQQEDVRATYEWDPDAADLEALRRELRDPGAAYLLQLKVAARRFGKAAALSRPMRALELAGALVLVVAAGFLVGLLWGVATEDVPAWSLLVAVGAPVLLVGLYLKQKFKLRALYAVADAIYTWFVPVLVAPLLWLGSVATLWTSKRFLAEGRIEKLRSKP
jgi:hypothetical protein